VSTAESRLAEQTRSVAGFQIITSVIVAALFLLQGPWESASALYGALASIATAMLLSRGIRRAGDAALSDPKKSMKILYLGAVQRFLLVVLLLGAGLALIKLEPVALIVGFALTRLSFLLNSRTKTNNVTT
jgi:ATP synthase protein I